MKHKCLFLEGNMQIGKSTTILKNINSLIPNNHVGGFMCQRLVADEETKAFCLTPFDKVESSIIEYKPHTPNVFLENISGKWVRNDEVFNTIGIEMLSNLSLKKLIVLDEIGGLELLTEQLREKLYELLSGNIPIIGVIKSNNNKFIMKKSVKIDDEYSALYQKLCSDIENIYNGKILKADKNNMVSIQQEIGAFLNEIMKGY